RRFRSGKPLVELGIAATAVAAWVVTARRTPLARRAFANESTLARGTRFLVSSPHEGAVQQVAALSKAQAFTYAAALTTLVTVPQALWSTGGTPEEARAI